MLTRLTRLTMLTGLLRPLLAVMVTSSFLLGQKYLVSPPHAVNVEGTSSSGLMFSYPLSRQQQVDSNPIGQQFVLVQGIAYRQSNSHSRTGAVARTIEVQIDMGFGIANPTTTYDNNYKANTRKTVLPKQSVNLPDWTGATPTPAPFSLTFPFKTLFVYSNKESLIWDIMVTKNSSSGQYYIDWFPSAPNVTKGTTPQVLGKGCATKNGAFTHTTNFTADTTNLNLAWGATNAPSQAPVIAALGLNNPNLNIGWCDNLHTDALVLLPRTTANSVGTVTGTLQLPWQSTFAGIMLYSQVVATDTSQPTGLTLTNGLMGSTPFAKGGGGGAALKVYGLYRFQAPFDGTGIQYINAIPVQYTVR